MRDMVLILNFDDACTRAIARGLRAEHVYCKIVPGNIALEEVRAQQPLGVILSGGVAGGVPGGMDMGLLQEGYPLLAMGDTAAMLCRALGGDAQPVAQIGGERGLRRARALERRVVRRRRAEHAHVNLHRCHDRDADPGAYTSVSAH